MAQVMPDAQWDELEKRIATIEFTLNAIMPKIGSLMDHASLVSELLKELLEEFQEKKANAKSGARVERQDTGQQATVVLRGAAARKLQ